MYLKIISFEKLQISGVWLDLQKSAGNTGKRETEMQFKASCEVSKASD